MLDMGIGGQQVRTDTEVRMNVPEWWERTGVWDKSETLLLRP